MATPTSSANYEDLPRPVLNKLDFAIRYGLGEFGNRAPTWQTLDDFLASGYTGLVHIRNRVAQGPSWYNQLASEIPYRLDRFCAQFNVRPESVYLSGMAPHQYNLIQGEVRKGLWVDWASAHDWPYRVEHVLLRYTTVEGLPMRDALEREQRQVAGIEAWQMLARYLCPNSWHWLKWLLYAYEDHIVEFSTFSVDWGTIPNYNTVFWEVRRY